MSTSITQNYKINAGNKIISTMLAYFGFLNYLYNKNFI